MHILLYTKYIQYFFIVCLWLRLFQKYEHTSGLYFFRNGNKMVSFELILLNIKEPFLNGIFVKF